MNLSAYSVAVELQVEQVSLLKLTERLCSGFDQLRNILNEVPTYIHEKILW